MIRTRKMRVEGKKVTRTKKGEGTRMQRGKEGGGGDKIQEGRWTRARMMTRTRRSSVQYYTADMRSFIVIQLYFKVKRHIWLVLF